MEPIIPAPTYPRPGQPSLALRILRFPLTRFVLGSIFVFLVPQITVAILLVIYLIVTGQVKDPQAVGKKLDDPAIEMPFTLAVAVLTWAAFVVFVRLIEWRRVTELGARRAAPEALLGAAIGGGLMAAIVGVFLALGAYRVAGPGNPALLYLPLGLALGSGIGEELSGRCLWFRTLEEWLGSGAAIVLSSLIFGFLHWANPNATATSCLAIALEAGVVLGAAFMLTRRLWLPAGIHAAWNFTQGGIFGAPVSGQDWPGLIKLERVGPDWLTGGKFGPEASVVAVVISTAAGIALLAYAYRRGAWVSPLWVRNRRARAEAALAAAAEATAITTEPLPDDGVFRQPPDPENLTERPPDGDDGEWVQPADEP